MAEEFVTPPTDDITDNDKLMAALSYPIPIVALIILIAEDMKARPFQKFHVGGVCGFISLLLWLITLYWAYEAYQGKYFEIPWLTDFLKGQNWL
jgi:uncharacterized membrane protein